MFKKILGFTICALFASTSFATPLSKAKSLINNATQGSVVIQQHFKSVGNLEGFIIKPKTQAGHSVVVYADKQGQYLFVGALMNAKGENLTHLDTVKYIQSKRAKAAFTAFENAHWIQQGKPNAPHLLYVLAEPNCSLCHQLYESLRPLIKSGQVQVRWLFVAFIKPSSTGKAAAIMQAKHPALALDQDEQGFNLSTESGAIKPAESILPETQRTLKHNEQLMTKFQFVGTPVMAFKTTKGKYQVIPGALPKHQLMALLKTIAPAKGH